MIKKNINHWTYLPSLEGLLFFSQLWSEMLFDYVLDTFKPRVMNTCLLTFEAQNILRDVEEKKIEDKNIEYIIDELNWSYSFDPVAKAILKDTQELYLPLKEINNRKDLKLKLQLLGLKLTLNNYIEKTKELLSNSIRLNHKKDIEILSDILISSLKAKGYNQAFIFFQLNTFFFNPTHPINDLTQLDEFLSIFNLETIEYLVISKATNDFLAISETYKDYDVSEITNLTQYNSNPETNAFIFSITTNQVFLGIDKINALDAYSARKRALRLLNKLSDYYSFFHHKNKPSFSEDVIAIRKSNQEISYITSQTSPMKKGTDYIPRKAALKLDEFLEKADFNSVTIRKIDRALDLHGLSLEQDNPENQILNLWISLEMLLPNDLTNSKIQQITGNLIPFLSIEYIYKIIKDISYSISRWRPLRARFYLNQIPDEVGISLIEKYAALIILDEFSNLRDSLFSELDDFPLL
jgi:hypothetical protein